MKDESELPLEFELCTHPPALFESSRQMREVDKPPLANAMKLPDNPSPITPDLGDICRNLLYICSVCEEEVPALLVVFNGYGQGLNT